MIYWCLKFDLIFLSHYQNCHGHIIGIYQNMHVIAVLYGHFKVILITWTQYHNVYILITPSCSFHDFHILMMVLWQRVLLEIFQSMLSRVFRILSSHHQCIEKISLGKTNWGRSLQFRKKYAAKMQRMLTYFQLKIIIIIIIIRIYIAPFPKN